MNNRPKHFRNAEKSKTMRTLARLLLRKRGATGWEICRVTGSTRASSDVSELRQWGAKTGRIRVSDGMNGGRSKNGKRITRWTAVRK